jgi:hypothetical protein
MALKPRLAMTRVAREISPRNKVRIGPGRVDDWKQALAHKMA